MIRIKHRSFLKIARLITLFIFGMFVAIFIALSQVNLETLRSNIVSVLQDSTGMPVEIKGKISWKFSLRPKVVLNEVLIKNADWAEHENGFYAKKIDVTVNLISLFRDKPSIENLKIYNGTVFMEKNAAGEYSLQSKNSEPVSTDESIQKFPFDLDFGLESIELSNFSADIEQSHYFVSDLHISYEEKNNIQEYTGWLKSDAKFYPFIISFSEFNSERNVYPVRIALSTGGDALVANLALDSVNKTPIDFGVKGNIYDAAEIGKVFGLSLPEISPMNVDIAGGLQNKKLIFRKCNLELENTDIKISGDFNWAKKIPEININIKSDNLNLEDIFPKMYKGSGEEWIHPNRDLNVFKNVPLYGELLNKYNLKLNVDIKQFDIYEDFVLKNILIATDLKNSQMKFDFKSEIAGGNLHTGAELIADKDGKLNVIGAGFAERIYVGEILNQLGEPNIVSDLPVNFEFYLRGSGSNLSELMSDVTGPFNLYSVGPGYIHSGLVSYIYGTDLITDLRHNLQDLFTSKKKYNQITVMGTAINLKFRNGKVETQNGVAVETNAINIRLVGGADLGAETLKASLITVPVRGLKLSLTGNVVNSMEFDGNIAEPDVKINKAAVAGKVASATGLGLLIAPFTGGIGLVAGAGFGLLAGDLLENWLADEHPCRTAMEKGAPPQNGDPDWLNQPMASLVSQIIKQ